jgi:outer membrane receptor protein involved in Fe transport
MLRRIALVFLAASAAFPQTASLTGRITDSTGAAVPGAKVTVKAVASGIETTVDSNDQGFYNLTSLPPGAYTVAVTKPGFQTLRQTDLELVVQQVARLDLTLQVGQISETVEVRAQSIVLDSETATLGQVVQAKQITDLPLLGRNTYALAMIVPGVRPSGGVNNLVVDQISTVSYAINGQRAAANEFLLDGAPNSAPSQNQPVINANPDMVQEFKVETNSFSAEYGRAAGGIFNVVTKSGSNNYHLSLYEFLRNDKLNANDFFANSAGQPAPPFKFNQFGGTLGGPVAIPKLYNGHNKTFFFVSVESVRFVQGITFVGTVPRAPELGGDFSNIRNAAGALITIYDPLTTAANPAGGGSIRQAFPGNRIPDSRVDPVARNAAKFFPAPNAAGTNAFTGVNNYARTDGNKVNKDSVSYRVDHYFNQKNRFFARYSADDTPFIRAAPYGPANPASPGTGPQTFGRRNSVVEDTHTFSPTLLGTFRYSYTRLSNFRSAFSEPFDIATLGFPADFGPQLVPRAFPNFTLTGYNVTGSIANIVVGGSLGATDIIRLGNDTHAPQANLTKSLSRHTIKSGFEYRVIHFNNLQTGANTPVFNFNAAFTQGPNPAASSATAGHALASFLLGDVSGGNVNPAPAVANQTKYYGAYLQDAYKVSTRLTVNLGLRWEMETPRTDRFNQLTNFDFGAKPPLNAPNLNMRGVLTFVGVNGLPRTNTIFDKNNFAPRFGFAYQVAPKTVLRGGSGIFYSSITGIGSGFGSFGVSGFSAQTTMVASLDGLTPFNTLRNPFPAGLVQASGSSQGPATLLGQAVNFTDRSNLSPYAVQWNFNVQHELPGALLVEVGYIGSHGVKFPENRSLNQLPDSALALKDDLRTQVSNPFAGQITSGILAQSTVARAQLLRPYPHFDGLTSSNVSWATSIYHALGVKAEKRYANGLTMLGTYTFSKSIDYGIGTFAGEGLGGAGFQDWNNLRAERSVSTLDQTHRLIFNTVYELPFYRNGHGIAGKALGGWQISGIYVAYSGNPLGAGSATNNTFSQGGGQRPNWTGVSARLDNPTPQRWFDTSQFTTPAAYTFGNSARTYSGLRSDSAGQLDFSLLKNTRIRERWNLQFRAEFFNLTNTPRFAPPNMTQGNNQFGTVSSMASQPRVIQFALKLLY